MILPEENELALFSYKDEWKPSTHLVSGLGSLAFAAFWLVIAARTKSTVVKGGTGLLGLVSLTGAVGDAIAATQKKGK